MIPENVKKAMRGATSPATMAPDDDGWKVLASELLVATSVQTFHLPDAPSQLIGHLPTPMAVLGFDGWVRDRSEVIERRGAVALGVEGLAMTYLAILRHVALLPASVQERFWTHVSVAPGPDHGDAGDAGEEGPDLDTSDTQECETYYVYVPEEVQEQGEAGR